MTLDGPPTHASFEDGLVEAAAGNLRDATWQRCRTHYAGNLLSICPKSMWPAVKKMLHPVYEQPDTGALNFQFDWLIEYTAETLPAVAERLGRACEDLLVCTGFPKCVWTQIWWAIQDEGRGPGPAPAEVHVSFTCLVTHVSHLITELTCAT